jgi:Peptidase family C25
MCWEGGTAHISPSIRLTSACRHSKICTATVYEIFRLEYRHNETVLDWLQRYQTAPGSVDPKKVPYYVLLIGNPTEIPFDFQCLLDVEYAVGRLGFDHVHHYEKYAESIVNYETTGKVANARKAVVWGTHHLGDGFTDLTTAYLTTPLCKGENDEPALGAKQAFSLRSFTGWEATKANLLNVLRGKEDKNPPAILFTASHGMGWPKEDPQGQKVNQGALLCQDWTGVGTIGSSQYLTAAEIPDDANIQGMVALIVACYSAGVPAFDAFLKDRKQGPVAIANAPFISALPQRLLAHPNGGALAVIGHVERIWSLSFVPPGLPSQLIPFRNFFGRVMSGEPIGHAMSDFNKRYAVLAAELLKDLDETQPDPKPSDEALVWKWIERTDAQNFVVLGDPAVHIRVNDLN